MKQHNNPVKDYYMYHLKHVRIFKMKLITSCGKDGLSVEFYRCLWDILEQIVVDSLNEGYIEGELSEFQKNGLITLIYNKKVDPLYLKNWRPGAICTNVLSYIYATFYFRFYVLYITKYS